jgi:hypothetical protein
MAICKQTIVDSKEKERYVGFINYEPVTPRTQVLWLQKHLYSFWLEHERIGNVQLATFCVIRCLRQHKHN